ncbi:MAG: hypothetical protein RJB34_963 [Pseudomonadota bacterium]|jgi:glyoxylase-like metal-dependent hydrolase (beta-lactamase superfamily II)
MLHHTLSSLGIHILERGWLSSNCVLMLDAHSSSLVDSGHHTHASQTVSWVVQQLNDRPLDRLINTHLHSDHCGANAALQSTFPNLRTFIPSASQNAVQAWDRSSLTFHDTGQNCPKFQLTDTLRDQEILILAGLPWQVIAVKGHDPEGIILFQSNHRILISADALWNNGFGVVFPEMSAQSGFQDVEHTLNLIESLAPLVVIPGHGPVFTDVADALSRARARLAYFQQAPSKHIRHGLKVLIKFKLLACKQASVSNIMAWCRSTPHVHAHMPREESDSYVWLSLLLDELCAAAAVRRVGQWVYDH